MTLNGLNVNINAKRSEYACISQANIGFCGIIRHYRPQPSPADRVATWPAASGLRGLRNVFSSTAEARLDQTGIAEPNELALRKAERKTGDQAFVSFACDEMGRSDER
jgi:hypothetical protein